MRVTGSDNYFNNDLKKEFLERVIPPMDSILESSNEHTFTSANIPVVNSSMELDTLKAASYEMNKDKLKDNLERNNNKSYKFGESVKYSLPYDKDLDNDETLI